MAAVVEFRCAACSVEAVLPGAFRCESCSKTFCPAHARLVGNTILCYSCKPEIVSKAEVRNPPGFAGYFREFMVMVGLVIVVITFLAYYRSKALGPHGLDRYISLKGYELSYLQAYQFMLLLLWAVVAVAAIGIGFKLYENWEINDLKKMLENRRNGNKKR